ncbi:hypothetical protein NIES4071_08110 [Calothrix sp. NIES-4071]|nr:hypothetical protein NIES4071_08110 [Calothrix sp. NIES-4071]BAZ55153.1 hypothetical protein NIES4105_08070 [Calothrix sp. NIES-4105]
MKLTSVLLAFSVLLSTVKSLPKRSILSALIYDDKI